MLLVSQTKSQQIHFLNALFTLLVCAGLCIVLPASVMAAEVRLTLGEAINIALANNEDIEESFRRVDAANADIMAAHAPYDLNVFAESRYSTFIDLTKEDYEYQDSVPNAAQQYWRADAGVSQRLPSGGTLRAFYTYSYEQRLGLPNFERHFNKGYLTVELTQSLLRGVRDKEVQGKIHTAMLAMEDSVEGRSLSVSQITLAVIRAYWALAIAQNNLAVAEEVLVMAKEVLRREIVRNKEGISQGVDVERAQLAVEQREYTIVQYKRDADTARDYLLLLINSPTITMDSTVIPTSPLTQLSDVSIPDETYSMDLAFQNRYEIKQANILLKQLDIEYDIHTNNLLPRLDVVVGGTSQHGNDYLRAAEGFSDTSKTGSAYAGLMFSYPLQNREARGTIEKTRQLMRIAQDRLNKTRRTIMTEVKGVLHNFTMAKQGIPLAQKSYTLAQSVVAGEQTRFEMGEINNRDLLASHDVLGREKINFYVAKANFNVALAEFRFACATILEKYNITLTDEGARMN